MYEPASSNSGRALFKRGHAANVCAALMISALLSVSILVFAYKTSLLATVGGGLFFCAMPFFLLKGNIFRRSVYWFLVIQFTASLFLQFSMFVTVMSLMFFPIALGVGVKARFDGMDIIPNRKSLLLLLSGWAVSMIYLVLVNFGEFKYYLMYDIFFLLGLAAAYEIYFFLKLKLFDVEKVICYIALSGLLVICLAFAKYLIGGNAGLIFNERFGTYVGINPNLLASYLDLALPCAVFTAFFEQRSSVKKLLFYALSLFYAGIILMTATRGSLPGVVIIVMYVIWRRRSKVLLLTILACAAIIFLALGSAVIERTFNPAMEDMMSNIGRVEMLRSAFKILGDNHYFFGIGMNNFSLAKFDYGFPHWFDSKGMMSSHNFFVEIWLGWGILGLIGWLIFNIGTVSRLLRKNKDNGAANAVAFAIIAFSAHGLFDSVCANFSMMFTYFLLLGTGLFIIARTNYVSSNSNSVRADFDQSNP